MEPIGQGGMGTVYRARDPMIDRLVAIKTIDFTDSGDAAARQELRDRVLREASAAGALSHPNIVTVHDVGEIDSRAYIVMEYVDGVTLWQLRDSGEALSREKIVDILRQTAVALDYAHEKGIIHRDVKPGNIMITRDGRVTITDFGIARTLTGERLTRTGMIVGTPHYMAPEQLGKTGVGPAADQFALAINAYEALTGKKPFDADNFSALLAMILNQDPPPLRSIDPEIPRAVETVLKRALEKDPKKRYPSCSALGDALAEAIGSPATQVATEASTRRSGVPVLAWITGAIAVVALAAWMVFSSGRGGDADPNSEPEASALAQQGGEPGSQVEAANSPGPEADELAAEAGSAAAVPADGSRSDGSSEGETARSPLSQAAESPAGRGATPTQPQTAEQQRAGQSRSAPAGGGQRPESSRAADSPTDRPVSSRTSAARLALTGPLVTVVWKGELQTGQTLTIQAGAADSGGLSRPLPAVPMQVEISPQDSLDVLEAPSAGNGWARMRIHNSGRSRTLIFIRYRELSKQ